MFVDASALVAILMREPDGRALSDRLESEGADHFGDRHL
jgi:uncharacterized protein with PIN domain